MPFRKKLLGLFIAIAFQPALLAKDATLEEIASAFTERQKRFTGVRWQAWGKTTVPAHTTTLPDAEEMHPQENYTFENKLEILLDLSSQRCRRNAVRELFHTDQLAFNKEVLHNVFDGKS